MTTPVFTRASEAYKQDGTQVAAGAPRYEAGKFGQGIMIEEGTTNLFVNPNFSANAHWGTPIWHSSGGINNGAYCEYNYAWNFCQNVTLTRGVAYSCSVYARRNATTDEVARINISADTPISIIAYSLGAIVSGDGATAINCLCSIPDDGKWHRFWVAFSLAGTGTYSTLFRFLQGGGSGTVDFDGAQLEAKPYPTSFIDISRAAETLTVPAEVLNKGNWTISLWLKLPRIQNRVLSLVELWLDNDNKYSLELTQDNKLMAGTKNNADWTWITDTEPINEDTWYLVSFVGDGSNIKLFKNGISVINSPYTEPAGELATDIFIGCNPTNSSFNSNAIIDDLRIDKVARTDAEILVIYNSGQPLPVDKYTTCKLNFDNSLIVSRGFISNDSDTLSLVDTENINASFIRNDNDTLLLADEYSQTSYLAFDSSELTLVENTILTNVFTAMDAAERQIFGKVEITYTDPFMDQSINVACSEQANVAQPEQVADNVIVTPYKWFSLHDNVLDGTYHPVDPNSEIGWWSNVLSDADGVFSLPPTLTVTFTPRLISDLKVVGDPSANVFPVDFTIQCYAGTTAVYTEIVTANTLCAWAKTLDSKVAGVTSIVLTIAKINKANYTARVIEFYTAVIETYTDDARLVSIHTLEEKEINYGSLPVGNISSNEIDIQLENADGYFDPVREDVPLRGLLIANRKIRVWLGVLIDGLVQWEPQGIYWTTQWDAPKNGVVATVTARDLMELMDNTTFETSLVYENYSLGALAEVVLEDYGLTSSEYVIDSELYNLVVPFAWFPQQSHRACLKQIAEAGLATVFVNSAGLVVFDRDSATEAVVYNFDENKNLYDIKLKQNVGRSTNSVDIVWGPYHKEAASAVLNTTGLNINIPAGGMTEISFNYSSAPATDISQTVLSGGAHLVLTSANYYAWGAILQITNNGAAAEVLTGVTITGKAIKRDTAFTLTQQNDELIGQWGKVPYSLNNVFIQDYNTAIAIATTLLASYSNPLRDYSLETRGCIALALGDRVTVPINNAAKQAVVVRQEHNYDGTLDGTVDVKLL